MNRLKRVSLTIHMDNDLGNELLSKTLRDQCSTSGKLAKLAATHYAPTSETCCASWEGSWDSYYWGRDCYVPTLEAMRPTPRACRSRVPSRRPSSFEATSRQGYTQWSVLVAGVMRGLPCKARPPCSKRRQVAGDGWFRLIASRARRGRCLRYSKARSSD
jgi:hypothetical protein